MINCDGFGNTIRHTHRKCHHKFYKWVFHIKSSFFNQRFRICCIGCTGMRKHHALRTHTHVLMENELHRRCIWYNLCHLPPRDDIVPRYYNKINTCKCPSVAFNNANVHTNGRGSSHRRTVVSAFWKASVRDWYWPFNWIIGYTLQR